MNKSVPESAGGAESDLPSLRTGYCILVSAAVFLVIGSYATFFSGLHALTGIWVLDVFATDTHYKYFLVLLVPTTAYFVIANWVGWQYYRNS